MFYALSKQPLVRSPERPASPLSMQDLLGMLVSAKGPRLIRSSTVGKDVLEAVLAAPDRRSPVVCYCLAALLSEPALYDVFNRDVAALLTNFVSTRALSSPSAKRKEKASALFAAASSLFNVATLEIAEGDDTVEPPPLPHLLIARNCPVPLLRPQPRRLGGLGVWSGRSAVALRSGRSDANI